MDWLYKKVLAWALGEAIANSDRIKVAVAGVVTVALTQIFGACGVCSAFLTPEVVQKLSYTVGGLAVTLILSLTHRDIAAPGEAVPGAAMPLPPPPPEGPAPTIP